MPIELNKVEKKKMKDRIDTIIEVFEEFDKDENMETYQALDKIREIVFADGY